MTRTSIQRLSALAVAAFAAFALAGCNGDTGNGGYTGPAPTDTTTPDEGVEEMRSAAIATGSTDLGEIIVDSDGMSLYLFTNDDQGAPTCYDECAVQWPPLLADEVSAEGDADAALVDIIERADGSMQVTYNGHPLYYWAGDTEPGHTNGQGVNGIWFVVSPAGDQIG
jgi:predicted lipoprotein with Yx(FWY)xxD motif